MMGIQLDKGQLEAAHNLHNGSILCGGVGSGKSRTSLAYFFFSHGGKLRINGKGNTIIPDNLPKLYIITTAKKRDDNEWKKECAPFLVTATIDSWNNIKKYVDVKDAFFIFDEQRLVGSGAWVKAFYKIAKKNEWILISATPANEWKDYTAVFVANGFYRNQTDFAAQHIVYNRFVRYPKKDHYVGIKKLEYNRDKLLVNIAYDRTAVRHHIYEIADYSKDLYKSTCKNRWNPYLQKPFKNAGALCYTLRKIVNSDESRQCIVKRICDEHRRVIIFYNFDYELEALKNINYAEGTIILEYNGHKHDQLSDDERWVYLVQYTSGSEGWNCTSTNVTIFYSQNYSYRVLEQACGRIDRRNTPYKDLYYYHIRSSAPIDRAITKAISNKKLFNERAFSKF